MPLDRASFFSRPDTVMRSHLTADELHLVNIGDPSVHWRSPSLIAFVIRHWIQSALVLVAVVAGALVLLLRMGSPEISLILAGLILIVLSIEVAVLEVRLFFRTYLRYIITPTRIIRMDGIIDRRSSSIEWSNITDISDHLGVLGQLLDYGNIAVETANENSKFGELVDVPRPREFLERMNAARIKVRKTPIAEAALRALVSLESLLNEGGLVVKEQPAVSAAGVTTKGWRVVREPRSEN
jgi:membrane protein YdbS with pleckstrin-like domain